MVAIHPTTSAIIAGLRGHAYEGSALLHHLAEAVDHLVRETRLADAEAIAKSGEEGWDLGYRQDGQRYEITARRRDERAYEMLITAMIDRRSAESWTYHWLVQGPNLANAFPSQLYPNGPAESFQSAMTAALSRLAET